MSAEIIKTAILRELQNSPALTVAQGEGQGSSHTLTTILDNLRTTYNTDQARQAEKDRLTAIRDKLKRGEEGRTKVSMTTIVRIIMLRTSLGRSPQTQTT